jgi:hypothetical protein
MTGSQTFGLFHALYVVRVGKNRTYLVGAVAYDHNNAVGTRIAGGIDGPPYEWLVQQLVCDLGMTGLHARSFASGEDNRVNGHKASNSFAVPIRLLF